MTNHNKLIEENGTTDKITTTASTPIDPRFSKFMEMFPALPSGPRRAPEHDSDIMLHHHRH
jgi:hypothetical protein